MAVLVGSTGFVGGHVARSHPFEHQVHRVDVSSLRGLKTDLLVCAGLPAAKWLANQEPAADWGNMTRLAQVLTEVKAERAVLISTVDVYQPAIHVDETHSADFNGVEAYGSHRAWFEAFFRSNFRDAFVVRLPALYAQDVRKNLIHDLLKKRSDQLQKVNPASTFQFFDVTKTWSLIRSAMASGISMLNAATAPVTAQAVADLFGVELGGTAPPQRYDMRSVHAESFGGYDGYLFTAESALEGISRLREGVGP